MLNDRKITDWTQPVSSLDDRPQMTASALKAAFDSNTNQLKPAVNGMIDDLTGTGGAGNIGVDVIAGVTGTTVQAMLAALKALIDLCDTSAESDDKLNLKADKTTTDKLVKTITLNADTGVFTIKTDDGTTTTIDTMLEKIPVNCYLDGQEFVLVLDDGTEQRADLSDFLTPTEFTDSSTIDFSVSGSTVTATIKNGSITLAMLESTVMSTIQGYVTAAQTAAGNAATSETNAGTYRDQAQTAATNSASSASEAGAKSTLSESWAIGGTGTRQGEDTNNSKYFAQQSANSAATAQGWSDSAMEQADAAAQSAADAAQSAADAEAIAGGDYIPNSQKGVAGGVATLGSDGKVSSTQLPEMNYIPTSQKGAASGVASLDATGKLEETQKPDYTASEVGAVPTTRTVNGKSLSADVVLTGEDIKTSASDKTTISSQLSNLNTLVGGATTAQDAVVALGALFAISAAAAYNPSGTYAVGDYCTNDGNLYKCNTPINGGEAWNAAHWTATTVAAELSGLSAVETAVPKKLSMYRSLSDLGISGITTISEVCESMQDGCMYSSWNDKTQSSYISDAPDPFDIIQIFRVSAYYTVCRSTRVGDGVSYVGTWNAGMEQPWSGWLDDTVLPITQESLPLAEGVSATTPCVYYKKQDKEVAVIGSVQGTLTNGMQIAALPALYTPAENTQRPAVIIDNMDHYYAATITIQSDGEILLDCQNNLGNSVWYAFFQANFVAEG